MLTIISYRRIALLCFLFMIVLPVHAENYPDVRKAQESVYRIWLGLPLPKEFSMQTGTSYRPDLDNKGYAVAPLTGLQMQSKASGKTQEAGGQGIVFQYGAQPYLLLATGSAYSISKQGHLLTNARLAANTGGTEVFFTDPSGMRYNGGNGQVKAFVVNAISPKVNLLPADTVIADTHRDLAILSIKDTRALKPHPLSLADDQFADKGTQVFALGMEGISDQLGAKRGEEIDAFTYLSPISENGLLSRHIKPNGVVHWEHTAPTIGSMRGGPLVNQCGQVVATNQVGKGTEQSLFGAIASREAAAILRKQQIPFEQASGRCGGAAAKAANALDKVSSVAQTAVEKPYTWVPLAIIGTVILVACVIALRLLMWIIRRKKQHRTNHPSVLPTPRPPAIPNPRTVALPSEYRQAQQAAMIVYNTSGGNDIHIYPNQTLSIGRSHHCDIVIANDKISSHHMNLYFDGTQLFAEDNGSTNGTFANGNRIHGKTSLYPNDTLQLTADTNIAVFRIGGQTSTHHRDTSPHQVAILHAENSNHTVPLITGTTLTVGRAAQHTLHLTHPEVSGNHAQIIIDPNGHITIEDLQSTNGTFLNGQRITKSDATIGQTVSFGNHENAYRIMPPDAH